MDTFPPNRNQRVLLVNPPYTFATYLSVGRNAGGLQHPILSLAYLGGSLKNTADVEILDLDVVDDPVATLHATLARFRPDVVGITATTPIFPSLLKIAREVKTVRRETVIVAGGVHVSTRPLETFRSDDIDVVVVGEADWFLKRFIESGHSTELPGAYFRTQVGIRFNGPAELISNLDELPMPAWDLYDLPRYSASRLVERHSPGGLMETSRGCPYQCVYCNKATFGSQWRVKSVDRVIREIKAMISRGFKEIHIEDDGFSTDLERAKTICRRMITENLQIPWTILNGIRVDRVDRELFSLLKAADCYQVAFGVESGDEKILKLVSKGIVLSQIEKAVRLADMEGLETFGFFMLGLPGETRASMLKTINLAMRLPFSIAKFAVTIPYPGTPLFEGLKAKNRILHENWEEYLVHNVKKPVFQHENLDWETIQKYYKWAHRKFYFRPSQIWKQLIGAVKNGSLTEKIRYFLRTKWV